jgi:CubicO group peptidase (beta-lactamase class C family)
MSALATEEIAPAVGSMRDAYAGILLPKVLVETFRRNEEAFSTRRIARGGPVRDLPYARRQISDLSISANGQTCDLADYLGRNRVGGLLVLKRGEIVFDYYDLGIDAATPWVSMSMAKSMATTLVGAAIQDGYIASVDDDLSDYLAELRGSAYDGVSIRHLMQMTSGVKWDDTHTDPNSERRHMLELQLAQRPGAILQFMSGLPRAAAPGTVWNYSTGETHVVGALVKAATGKWLADYLSEKVWSRAGMEADASWWLESPGGLEVAGSGVSATLRDYVRFALFIMEGAMAGGESVLPPGWVAEATAPREAGGQPLNYGYMWWPVPSSDGSFADGAFSARGIFGQYLYINPAKNLIIGVLSSRSKPKGSEAILDNDFFNSAAEALA